MIVFSVPARLGKGTSAKEIGHNLARERPKFENNLVRKRRKIGHSLGHERPSLAHLCTNAQILGIQHANETRSGYNFVGDRAGRYVNRAGHKGVRAKRKTVRAGRSTLRNMPSWNWKDNYSVANKLVYIISLVSYHVRGVTALTVNLKKHQLAFFTNNCM